MPEDSKDFIRRIIIQAIFVESNQDTHIIKYQEARINPHSLSSDGKNIFISPNGDQACWFNLLKIYFFYPFYNLYNFFLW